MSQFMDDLDRTLHKVRTAWFRRAIVVVSGPVFLVIFGIIGGMGGAIVAMEDFWHECIVVAWNGRK